MIDDVFKKEGLALGALVYVIKPLALYYLMKQIYSIFSST